MSKMSAKIKEEIAALIPPTVFFFGSLLMIGLVRALLLRGTGIAPVTPLAMLLAALVLAKAGLLADLWPAINRYPDKPLGLQRRLEDADLFRRGDGAALSASLTSGARPAVSWRRTGCCWPKWCGPTSGRSRSSS
jgi:hypothetical protein